MSNLEERSTEAQFVAQVAAALDSDALAGDINHRLDVARRDAVASLVERPVLLPTPWIPLGAVAATVLVAALVIITLEEALVPPFEDEQLFAAQELELLQEIEFLAWIDGEQTAETHDDAADVDERANHAS